MRRMYSFAVDVEVEDESGHPERLVENSMHFRTMNIEKQEVRAFRTGDYEKAGMSRAQIRG
jgi:hypothetical protein